MYIGQLWRFVLIYVISAVVGAIYGVLCGLLKYILLWRKMLTAGDDVYFKNSQVLGRMIASYIINAIVLLIVLFVRHLIEPLSFEATIIAAAIGLSVIGKVYSIGKIYSKVKE